MNASTFLNRLLRYALVGAVLGTLLGLGLLAADVVENPFWLTSMGILAGAILTPVRSRER